MAKKYNMTIGGNTVIADDYVEVRNPANTDEVVGLAPAGQEKHLNEAINDAQEAFSKWKHSSDKERVEACQTIAKVCEDNAEELAELLTKEQGKPLNGMGSRFELGGCAGWAGYTSSIGLSEKVLEDSDASNIVMQRQPLGVVGSITPWNFPLMIAIWHLVPAIRTGNTAVIKPSPFTPLSTLRMVELINEKLPKGLINIVSGGNELGAHITNHKDINKLIFTGSIATGKKVMSSAAQNVTPVTLELGGKNYFYPVTIVGDITDGVRLVDEEQFGTALPVIRYTNVDDAIAAANGLDFGLDASVWGHDKTQCAEVAAQLEAGTVLINKHADIAPHVPFGGIKCSGIGVEFGEEGLAAYTSIKIINAAA